MILTVAGRATSVIEMDHLSLGMTPPSTKRVRSTPAQLPDDGFQWIEAHRKTLEANGAAPAVVDCLNAIALRIAIERMSADEVVHLLGGIMARLQMPHNGSTPDTRLAEICGLTPHFLSRLRDPDLFPPEDE